MPFMPYWHSHHHLAHKPSWDLIPIKNSPSQAFNNSTQTYLFKLIIICLTLGLLVLGNLHHWVSSYYFPYIWGLCHHRSRFLLPSSPCRSRTLSSLPIVCYWHCYDATFCFPPVCHYCLISFSTHILLLKGWCSSSWECHPLWWHITGRGSHGRLMPEGTAA